METLIFNNIILTKGQIVQVINSSREDLINKKGKLLQNDGMFCLVEFFEYINGHDGGKAGEVKGKMGYCYWILEEHLLPISISQMLKDLEI